MIDDCYTHLESFPNLMYAKTYVVKDYLGMVQLNLVGIYLFILCDFKVYYWTTCYVCVNGNYR